MMEKIKGTDMNMIVLKEDFSKSYLIFRKDTDTVSLMIDDYFRSERTIFPEKKLKDLGIQFNEINTEEDLYNSVRKYFSHIGMYEYVITIDLPFGRDDVKWISNGMMN